MTDLQKHILGLVFYPGMKSLDIIGPLIIAITREALLNLWIHFGE
jgi:hypothetical protein